MLLGVWYFLLFMLLVGMAAGWLAWVVLGRNKALKKDRKPNWGALLGLGLVGSLVGGTVGSLLSGEGFSLQLTGMIGSFLGALVVVAIYQSMQNRKS